MAFRTASIVENDIQQRAVNVKLTVVLNKAHFAELVQEKPHSGARGADHFRQRLLAIFAITGSGFPCLPKLASRRSARGNLLSLAFKS